MTTRAQPAALVERLVAARAGVDEREGLMAHKFGAKACDEDGYRFPSLAERAEYRRLKLRVLAGDIADLELQPRYPLVVNGVKVAVYVADFRYKLVADGSVVVCDVKGVKTPVYRLKAKLMRACHGIEIVEV